MRKDSTMQVSRHRRYWLWRVACSSSPLSISSFRFQVFSIFSNNLDESAYAHIPLLNNMRDSSTKIMTLDGMLEKRAAIREQGLSLVFTNGCFDILHTGHTQYLAFARNQGDALIVGLNSDNSVRKAKGPARPINSQDDRALVLAALECVDYVVIFDEDEPKKIIESLLPDVLVKGADWAHYVSGREVVEANGGKVVLAPLVDGKSTTGTIAKMKEG